MAHQKNLLSGIQPSGRLHIGNYFGAMRQFVNLQESYDTYISVVNYHALTTVHDSKRLLSDTREAVIDHLAIGLDPEKVTLFVQSDVPQLTELAWIFNTLITVPYLSRAHAYKDKITQGVEASVGLFDYPVLMAADILLVKADVVPVGSDQKQHVEMARDIAQKFNQTFGETFVLPEPLIREEVATVPGIDGRKMSKSYRNTIPLFATKEEISKQVMAIVTDSSGGRPENVYAMHTLLKDKDELEVFYKEHEGNYKALKEALIDDLENFIAPLRKRREELVANDDYITKVITKGGRKVRELAEENMRDIRKKVGIVTTY